jgi:hypothetical protein
MTFKNGDSIKHKKLGVKGIYKEGQSQPGAKSKAYVTTESGSIWPVEKISDWIAYHAFQADVMNQLSDHHDPDSPTLGDMIAKADAAWDAYKETHDI